MIIANLQHIVRDIVVVEVFDSRRVQANVTGRLVIIDDFILAPSIAALKGSTCLNEASLATITKSTQILTLMVACSCVLVANYQLKSIDNRKLLTVFAIDNRRPMTL